MLEGFINSTEIFTLIINLGAVSTVLIGFFTATRKVLKRLDRVDDTDVRARRMEIAQRIHYDRDVFTDVETILSLYDEYKRLGGNSYIDMLVSEYIKKCNTRVD